jgi:hypothetical protein
VLAGLQGQGLRPAQALGAGVRVNRLTIRLGGGPEAVIDAVLGLDELAGGLGQLDDGGRLGDGRLGGQAERDNSAAQKHLGRGLDAHLPYLLV